MRLTSPPDISQYLVYTDVLLDIVVSGAPVLIRQFRTRRWGKLHRQGLRTPLPSIHLANLHSLPNKTDTLLLLSRLNKDFFKLCCSAFHGNLAEWRHSRQRTSSSELSADQIWSQSRTDGEITWRRDVLLHQWEVVYRRNSVKEGVLFWSRNAPHQLQAVQTRCGSSVRSFSWVSTFFCKCTWAQLYRNSLIWSQTQNNNTQTLFY